jgi:hypothetical protein
MLKFFDQVSWLWAALMPNVAKFPPQIHPDLQR